jgi:hypothetical protein
MTDTDLDLAARPGLPDPLRVLVEQYPRTGWETHPNFDGLTRFWLERHLMFRRLHEALLAEGRGYLDGKAEARRTAQAIARLGNTFLGELHGHHRIEDAHYFPTLAGLEPRLVAGFELLDRDHHRLDAELHALAETANTALRALSEPAPGTVPAAEARKAVGALDTAVAGFGAFLDRHLTDEEEIVVPVILAHAPDALR